MSHRRPKSWAQASEKHVSCSFWKPVFHLLSTGTITGPPVCSHAQSWRGHFRAFFFEEIKKWRDRPSPLWRWRCVEGCWRSTCWVFLTRRLAQKCCKCKLFQRNWQSTTNWQCQFGEKRNRKNRKTCLKKEFKHIRAGNALSKRSHQFHVKPHQIATCIQFIHDHLPASKHLPVHNLLGSAAATLFENCEKIHNKNARIGKAHFVTITQALTQKCKDETSLSSCHAKLRDANVLLKLQLARLSKFEGLLRNNGIGISFSQGKENNVTEKKKHRKKILNISKNNGVHWKTFCHVNVPINMSKWARKCQHTAVNFCWTRKEQIKNAEPRNVITNTARETEKNVLTVLVFCTARHSCEVDCDQVGWNRKWLQKRTWINAASQRSSCENSEELCVSPHACCGCGKVVASAATAVAVAATGWRESGL